MEPFDEVTALLDAVARVWPHLPRPDESLERAVLLHLRRVEAARASGGTGDAEAIDLLSALQANPAIAATLKRELDATATRDAPTPDIPGAVRHHRYLEIPILYATDRAPADPGASDPFTGARGTPSYGVARVSVPDDHRMGALEKPRLWKLQFRTEPAKHIVLLGTDQLTQDAFTRRGSEAIAVSATPEALLFVHGYNVTFADAARRAAQIAYDLQFDGLPMLYSWPSEGATLRYPTDADNSLWTRPHFADFLRLALSRLGARRLHLLAHSMGNRVVTPRPRRPHPHRIRRPRPSHLRRPRRRRRHLHPTRRPVPAPRRPLHPLRLLQRPRPQSLPKTRTLPPSRTIKPDHSHHRRHRHHRRQPTRHRTYEPFLLR
jgi:hypothetical protein